jgi:hypothetical protein
MRAADGSAFSAVESGKRYRRLQAIRAFFIIPEYAEEQLRVHRLWFPGSRFVRPGITMLRAVMTGL